MAAGSHELWISKNTILLCLKDAPKEIKSEVENIDACAKISLKIRWAIDWDDDERR